MTATGGRGSNPKYEDRDDLLKEWFSLYVRSFDIRLTPVGE